MAGNMCYLHLFLNIIGKFMHLILSNKVYKNCLVLTYKLKSW